MRCYMLISPFRIQFHLFGMDDILCEQGTVAGEDFDFLIICRIIHLAVPDQNPHPVGSNLKDGKTTYEIMDFPIYRLQNDVIPHTESPSSRFLKGFHILQIFIALPAAKLRFLLVILRHTVSAASILPVHGGVQQSTPHPSRSYPETISPPMPSRRFFPNP